MNEGKEERRQICIFKIFFSLKATSVTRRAYHCFIVNRSLCFPGDSFRYFFFHNYPTFDIVSSNNILLAVFR